MNHKIFTSIIIISIIIISMLSQLYPISMIYNYRIAQITRQPLQENTPDTPCTLEALVFDQYRQKADHIYQNFIGGLGSFIYNFRPYYFRADFAVSNIYEKTNSKTDFDGVEADDILFSGGRDFVINKNNVITLSGLFGVPTHQIFRLQHTDFGYGQVGLGVQLDTAHSFLEKNAIIAGVRYIYFVPRTALDNVQQKHTFTVGNISDMLIGYKKNWEHHGAELGYSLKFRYGAKVSPSFDDIVKKTNYTRSNFYAVYKYKFLIRDLPNRFLLNFAYSFDHVPKQYGNKYIITIWASWNLSF